MTLDELQMLAAEVPELKRRLSELEARAANQPPPDAVMRLDRASERHGVSVRMLRAWIADGTLPASQNAAGGPWMVSSTDVTKAIDAKRMRAIRTAPAARHDADSQADSIVARLPRRAAR